MELKEKLAFTKGIESASEVFDSAKAIAQTELLPHLENVNVDQHTKDIYAMGYNYALINISMAFTSELSKETIKSITSWHTEKQGPEK